MWLGIGAGRTQTKGVTKKEFFSRRLSFCFGERFSGRKMNGFRTRPPGPWSAFETIGLATKFVRKHNPET
jgi:hypothetical protein